MTFLSDIKFTERESALQQKNESRKGISPFVTDITHQCKTSNMFKGVSKLRPQTRKTQTPWVSRKRSQLSKVIYKASCWDCDYFYIGKTKRRLHEVNRTLLNMSEPLDIISNGTIRTFWVRENLIYTVKQNILTRAKAVFKCQHQQREAIVVIIAIIIVN